MPQIWSTNSLEFADSSSCEISSSRGTNTGPLLGALPRIGGGPLSGAAGGLGVQVLLARRWARRRWLPRWACP